MYIFFVSKNFFIIIGNITCQCQILSQICTYWVRIVDMLVYFFKRIQNSIAWDDHFQIILVLWNLQLKRIEKPFFKQNYKKIFILLKYIKNRFLKFWFRWRDGSVKHVHVTEPVYRKYREKLLNALDLFKKRFVICTVDTLKALIPYQVFIISNFLLFFHIFISNRLEWLQRGSRELFGNVIENKVKSIIFQ